MANALLGNPWIIDSTGTLTADMVQVRGIRWIGASTNAHAAVITNTDGVVKWASQAATATLGTPEESLIPFPSGGLKVPTLGSGKLYIYFA